MSSTASATEPRRLTGAWARDRAWAATVWAAMVAWTLALFALVRQGYVGFELGRFDLGNMVQAVWSTSQGRPLEVTAAGGDQVARLAGHVDPILVLLTPLWMLAPSPLTLAAVQIVAVSLGALPLLWLARKHLQSEKAAALLALAYLASPWIAWTAYDAIHPKTFAIVLFLFAIWFLDEDRLGMFAVVAVLAAASGELMGLTIAALGLWYAFARGRRTAGLVIATAGAAWSLVALFVIIPAFSGSQSVHLGLYEAVGGSPSGILETAVTDPGVILRELSRTSDGVYTFLLAAPHLGTFALAPGLALVAAPQLGVNLLADAGGPVDPRHHYIAGVVPFLFAAGALGLGRVARARRTPLAVMTLATSLLMAALFGPWPLVGGVSLRHEVPLSEERAEVLRRAIDLVPVDAPVSSSNVVGAHMAARTRVFTVPVVAEAEWIVLDTNDRWFLHETLPYLVERSPSTVRAFRDRLERSRAWVTAFEEDGVYVFRRSNAR